MPRCGRAQNKVNLKPKMVNGYRMFSPNKIIYYRLIYARLILKCASSDNSTMCPNLELPHFVLSVTSIKYCHIRKYTLLVVQDLAVFFSSTCETWQCFSARLLSELILQNKQVKQEKRQLHEKKQHFQLVSVTSLSIRDYSIKENIHQGNVWGDS